MFKTTPMMRICFVAFFAFVLCMFLWLAQNVHAIYVVPQTADFYVNDAARLLSSKTKKYIIDTNIALNKTSGAQVVVVTVPDLGGATLEEYATTMFRQYGIGDKQKNNGILLLLSIKERQVRIEVGYGLEGVLNDSKTGRIQDSYMIPHFKKGEWDKGIINGFNALVREIQNEYNAVEKKESEDTLNELSGIIFIIYSIVWTVITYWRVNKHDGLADIWKALLCYGVGGWILFSLILYSFVDIDGVSAMVVAGVGGVFVLFLLINYGVIGALSLLFGVKLNDSLHLGGGRGYTGGRSGGGGRSYRGGGGRSGGGGSSRRF